MARISFYFDASNLVCCHYCDIQPCRYFSETAQARQTKHSLSRCNNNLYGSSVWNPTTWFKKTQDTNKWLTKTSNCSPWSFRPPSNLRQGWGRCSGWRLKRVRNSKKLEEAPVRIPKPDWVELGQGSREITCLRTQLVEYGEAGRRSVWPDVEKCRHIGKNLEVFGPFLKGLFSIWQKAERSLGSYLCLGQISIFVNGQIFNIFWSHCRRFTTTLSLYLNACFYGHCGLNTAGDPDLSWGGSNQNNWHWSLVLIIIKLSWGKRVSEVIS